MTSQFRMARFRTAQTGNDIFELTHDDPLPVQEEEVLVRFDWISIDPAMSGWTTDKRSHAACSARKNHAGFRYRRSDGVKI